MDAEAPLVLQSAVRQGIAEEDALHAWAFAIDASNVGQGMVMHFGSDRDPRGDAMPRSLDDPLARADELADEFEGYEPREDDRGEPVLSALRRAAYRRALIERELVERVLHARQSGASWARIGNELGTSGEAARQRDGDKVDA